MLKHEWGSPLPSTHMFRCRRNTCTCFVVCRPWRPRSEYGGNLLSNPQKSPWNAFNLLQAGGACYGPTAMCNQSSWKYGTIWTAQHPSFVHTWKHMIFLQKSQFVFSLLTNDFWWWKLQNICESTSWIGRSAPMNRIKNTKRISNWNLLNQILLVELCCQTRKTKNLQKMIELTDPWAS